MEDQRYASTGQGMPNTSGKPATKVLRAKKDFPAGFRGSIVLPMHLILDVKSQNYETINLLRSPSLW